LQVTLIYNFFLQLQPLLTNVFARDYETEYYYSVCGSKVRYLEILDNSELQSLLDKLHIIINCLNGIPTFCVGVRSSRKHLALIYLMQEIYILSSCKTIKWKRKWILLYNLTTRLTLSRKLLVPWARLFFCCWSKLSHWIGP
jgi:hypothetical protein